MAMSPSIIILVLFAFILCALDEELQTGCSSSNIRTKRILLSNCCLVESDVIYGRQSYLRVRIPTEHVEKDLPRELEPCVQGGGCLSKQQ